MKFAPLLVFIALVLAADPAFACAVCFDANEETRGAFLGTTIFLSLFPLGMVFGFGFWFWRRVRMAESLDQIPPTQV